MTPSLVECWKQAPLIISTTDYPIDWVNMHFARHVLEIADDVSAGYPHPKIESGMHDEHCEVNLGCNVEFTTTNYEIKTTPKKEYEIVCDPGKCREEDKMDKERTKIIRNLKNLDDLVRSSIAKTAKLHHFEVKAVVSALKISFLRKL